MAWHQQPVSLLCRSRHRATSNRNSTGGLCTGSTAAPQPWTTRG